MHFYDDGDLLQALEANDPPGSIRDQQGAMIADVLAAGQRALKKLDLYNWGVGAEGAAAIGRAAALNTTLEEISFGEKQSGKIMIGDDGVAGIAEGLAKSQSLKALVLRDCGIMATGASALGAALEQSRTLEKLSIKYNKISDVGAASVAKVWPIARE